MIHETVKSGLDTSWITQILVKSEKPVLKALKIKDPEEEKKVEKLQKELFEQKLIFESLRRQLAEMKEEQKHQSNSGSTNEEFRGFGKHSEATIIRNQDYGWCFDGLDEETTTTLDCTLLILVVYISYVFCLRCLCL
jgi:hypothetical protein